MVRVFHLPKDKEIIDYMTNISYLCVFNNHVNAIFIDGEVDNKLNHI